MHLENKNEIISKINAKKEPNSQHFFFVCFCIVHILSSTSINEHMYWSNISFIFVVHFMSLYSTAARTVVFFSEKMQPPQRKPPAFPQQGTYPSRVHESNHGFLLVHML